MYKRKYILCIFLSYSSPFRIYTLIISITLITVSTLLKLYNIIYNIYNCIYINLSGFAYIVIQITNDYITIKIILLTQTTRVQCSIKK